MKTKYLDVKTGDKMGISNMPSFSIAGSISGMKKQYYGENALLVKCGSYIYNCTAKPSIYNAAH